jgi:hypothetical protein
VNAWVFAYRSLVGENLIDWLGPDQGRIDVPTIYEPHKRRFRRVDLEDVTLASDGHHHPRDLGLDHFGPLFPDATLMLFATRSAPRSTYWWSSTGPGGRPRTSTSCAATTRS